MFYGPVTWRRWRKGRRSEWGDWTISWRDSSVGFRSWRRRTRRSPPTTRSIWNNWTPRASTSMRFTAESARWVNLVRMGIEWNHFKPHCGWTWGFDAQPVLSQRYVKAAFSKFLAASIIKFQSNKVPQFVNTLHWYLEIANWMQTAALPALPNMFRFKSNELRRSWKFVSLNVDEFKNTVPCMCLLKN